MKQVSEMSDREIQEARLENSRIANNYLKSIKAWATFIGLVALAYVIFALIVGSVLIK